MCLSHLHHTRSTSRHSHITPCHASRVCLSHEYTPHAAPAATYTHITLLHISTCVPLLRIRPTHSSRKHTHHTHTHTIRHACLPLRTSTTSRVRMPLARSPCVCARAYMCMFQACACDLAQCVQRRHGTPLCPLDSLGHRAHAHTTYMPTDTHVTHVIHAPSRAHMHKLHRGMTGHTHHAQHIIEQHIKPHPRTARFSSKTRATPHTACL